jgi:hypothetical protein
MNQHEKEIFDFSISIFKENNSNFFNENFKLSHSERCIEIPWISSRLAKYKASNLLDIGFTMASLDYLNFLIFLRKNGLDLSALDIINPERVKNRYPADLINDVFSIPITLSDISVDNSFVNSYDAISLISTLEHIGFDKASYEDINSAFQRELDPSAVKLFRDPEIDFKVLSNISKILNDNGYLFISAPIGKGGPVLLRDSLGLYTAQWEYESESWNRLTSHPNFTLLEQFFFVNNKNGSWIEVHDVNMTKNSSSEMKSHAEGVALCLLKKN